MNYNIAVKVNERLKVDLNSPITDVLILIDPQLLKMEKLSLEEFSFLCLADNPCFRPGFRLKTSSIKLHVPKYLYNGVKYVR